MPDDKIDVIEDLASAAELAHQTTEAQLHLKLDTQAAEARLVEQAKKDLLLKDLTLAAEGLALAFAPAVAFGVIPSAAVPFATLGVKLIGDLVDAIKKAQ